MTDPDAPLVAFYGDSYTLGTGALDPSNRWSTVICARARVDASSTRASTDSGS